MNVYNQYDKQSSSQIVQFVIHLSASTYKVYIILNPQLRHFIAAKQNYLIHIYLYFICKHSAQYDYYMGL